MAESMLELRFICFDCFDSFDCFVVLLQLWEMSTLTSGDDVLVLVGVGEEELGVRIHQPASIRPAPFH